jgi:hypothetical protein
VNVYPRDCARLAALFREASATGVSDGRAMLTAIAALETERAEAGDQYLVGLVEAAVGMAPGDLARRTREFDSDHKFASNSTRSIAYWLLHQQISLRDISSSLGRSYHAVWQTLDRMGKRLVTDADLRAKVAKAKARMRELERGTVRQAETSQLKRKAA